MRSELLKIAVGGMELPCRATMGAMLRFKHESGREVTEIDPACVSDLTLWLWCCVKSACSCDGVPFDLSLLEFADRLHPSTLRLWAESQKPEPSTGAGAPACIEGAEKKTEA